MNADLAYSELSEVRSAWTQPIEVHRQLPSTQTCILERGPNSGVIVAVEQSGGRGRHGRAWSSPAGGLWFSLVQPTSRVDGLSLVAGLALARVVKSLGLFPWLRWPNDVLLGAHKLAGILVDARWSGSQGHAYVGVGINVDVDPASWAEDVRPLATSLSLSGIPRPHLGHFLLQFLREWSSLSEVHSRSGLQSLHSELEQMVVGSGRNVEVHENDGEKYNDRMVGLEPDGSLRLASGRQLYSVERLLVLP